MKLKKLLKEFTTRVKMTDKFLYFEYSQIVKTGNKAYKVHLIFGISKWFPKNQCQFLENNKQNKKIIAVPAWLAKKMEIEKMAVDFYP